MHMNIYDHYTPEYKLARLFSHVLIRTDQIRSFLENSKRLELLFWGTIKSFGMGQYRHNALP